MLKINEPLKFRRQDNKLGGDIVECGMTGFAKRYSIVNVMEFLESYNTLSSVIFELAIALGDDMANIKRFLGVLTEPANVVEITLHLAPEDLSRAKRLLNLVGTDADRQRI
ncbi:hypothetical protein TWF481_002980 [Arthrobotrys musiformis]|uniref:Uncharacterized protein n=1 Tax=Arthrobotrys musiformis TaxID=47236 RepID=A0AAV9VRU0_9PEZI